MINPAAKLIENLFKKDKLENKPTRDGYGLGLVEAGEKDERENNLATSQVATIRNLRMRIKKLFSILFLILGSLLLLSSFTIIEAFFEPEFKLDSNFLAPTFIFLSSILLILGGARTFIQKSWGIKLSVMGIVIFLGTVIWTIWVLNTSTIPIW